MDDDADEDVVELLLELVVVILVSYA